MGIKTQDGRWVDQSVDIGQRFIQYYNDLETMNSKLEGTFQEWEVETALKQMAPMKAPGPDGMPPLFYQHFWSTVDGNIASSILS